MSNRRRTRLDRFLDTPLGMGLAFLVGISAFAGVIAIAGSQSKRTYTEFWSVSSGQIERIVDYNGKEVSDYDSEDSIREVVWIK